jgi:hypothetical protein
MPPKKINTDTVTPNLQESELPSALPATGVLKDKKKVKNTKAKKPAKKSTRGSKNDDESSEGPDLSDQDDLADSDLALALSIAQEDQSTKPQSRAARGQSAAPPQKVRKTNEGGDVGEEALKAEEQKRSSISATRG